LKHGAHEPKKDTWDGHYNTWHYAIRGDTVDKRTLRIIVSFGVEKMLIITVIKVTKIGI